MPNVRDHDASVYLRLQGDALSVGGYEHNPIFWDEVTMLSVCPALRSKTANSCAQQQKRWRVEGVCGDAPGTSAKPRPPRVLVPTAAVVILSFPHLLQREPTRPSRCFGVLVTIETVFGARHMNSGVPSSFISVGFDFLTAKE